MTLLDAPYDEDGNLLHYAIPSRAIWRPAVPAQMTLRLLHAERGRSAAYFVWEDEDGHRYPMFLTDMVETLIGTNIIKGKTARQLWIPRKRGCNYGIGLTR